MHGLVQSNSADTSFSLRQGRHHQQSVQKFTCVRDGVRLKPYLKNIRIIVKRCVPFLVGNVDGSRAKVISSIIR